MHDILYLLHLKTSPFCVLKFVQQCWFCVSDSCLFSVYSVFVAVSRCELDILNHCLCFRDYITPVAHTRFFVYQHFPNVNPIEHSVHSLVCTITTDTHKLAHSLTRARAQAKAHKMRQWWSNKTRHLVLCACFVCYCVRSSARTHIHMCVCCSRWKSQLLVRRWSYHYLRPPNPKPTNRVIVSIWPSVCQTLRCSARAPTVA